MRDRRRQLSNSRCLVGQALVWASLFVAPLGAQQAELAKGSFLIASRALHDPNFVHSVILLLEYGEEGAMGVIINRPTQMGLATMLPEIESLERRTDTVWLGGPVSRWQMLLLARAESEIEGLRNVFDDVYLSASRVVLEGLLAEDGEFRVYAGYAGWSPGQLEHEVARGSWHIFPGEAAMVFDEAPDELWRELVQRADVKWVRGGSAADADESRAR